jgi:hypothetical protein
VYQSNGIGCHEKRPLALLNVEREHGVHDKPGQHRLCWLSQNGLDHGVGHPLLFLDDANAPNCQKNNGFSDLGNYSEWPKVAGAVIKAVKIARKSGYAYDV